MGHERGETVEEDGKWTNVYGKGTPLAGTRLPLLFSYEKPYYDTEAAASAADRQRSQDWHYEELRPNPSPPKPQYLQMLNRLIEMLTPAPSGSTPPAHDYHVWGELMKKQGLIPESPAYSWDEDMQDRKRREFHQRGNAARRSELGAKEYPREDWIHHGLEPWNLRKETRDYPVIPPFIYGHGEPDFIAPWGPHPWPVSEKRPDA